MTTERTHLSSAATFALGPVAAAAFPVVSLYSVNTATPFRAIFPALAAASLAGWLLYLLFRAYSKSSAKGALCATLFFAVVFAYGPIMLGPDTGNPEVDTARHVRLSLAYLGLVTAFGVFALALPRIGASMVVAARVASIIAVCVLGVAAVQALAGVLLGAGRKASVSAPVARAEGAAAAADIYHIVLDGYSRADVLCDVYGLDNSGFIEALRARGFYVADRSCSNYNQTNLSLSSTLNMRYLDEGEPGAPDAYRQYLADTMIQRNDVVDFLKSRGYAFVNVGSYFDATSHNASADVDISSSNVVDVNEFEVQLLLTTPFRELGAMSWRPIRGMHRARILSQFKGISDASRHGGPKYVFAHVICPHPPFVFAADGSDSGVDVPPSMNEGMSFDGAQETYRAGYRAQLQYVNVKTLEAVDAILAAYPPDKPPVIVISGDHGGGYNYDLRHPDGARHWERMSILNAYLVPDAASFGLYPSITPVNTYRALFNGLFDARLQLLPDRSFYASWTEPFRYTEVAPEALSPPAHEGSPRCQGADGPAGTEPNGHSVRR